MRIDKNEKGGDKLWREVKIIFLEREWFLE